uniref:mitochondrial enolase superfamily member 1 n=1 Tax=Ictidomys tridecemlineatus TaxID=43179 RepID=UPI001A9F5037
KWNSFKIVVCAVNALAHHVLHKDLKDIVSDFRGFYRQLTSDGQLRWIGPEKGVVHLATAAILNAVWDLWAKQEGKPLWKLLVDMDPRALLSCIDFRYITDVLTEEDAYEILKKGQIGKKERGHSERLCAAALKDGWTRFKVKVGADLQDDMRRWSSKQCLLVGSHPCSRVKALSLQMMDANQRWDVPEAVEWMSKLAEFKPLWIEEPTSPDDILGHAAISKVGKLMLLLHWPFIFLFSFPEGSLKMPKFLCIFPFTFPHGIFEIIVTCDKYGSCRLYFHLFEKESCWKLKGYQPSEEHLIIFDYISVSASLKNRMCEYVDHLHEHFKYPVVIKQASYMPPKDAGYSTEMKEDSVRKHQYPDGDVWKKLLAAQEN